MKENQNGFSDLEGVILKLKLVFFSDLFQHLLGTKSTCAVRTLVALTDVEFVTS